MNRNIYGHPGDGGSLRTDAAVRRKCLIGLVVLALGGLFLTYVWGYLTWASATRLFKRYVMDPIPALVENIKVGYSEPIGAYTYIFRFDITSEDLELILSEKSLKQGGFNS